MNKKLLLLTSAAMIVAFAACKNEKVTRDDFNFGSSDQQATGTMRAPDQPESSTAPVAAAPAAAASPVALAPADSQFVTKAALGGLAEVQLGNLALQKASSPEVREFAQMMVADHTRTNQEFNAIAAAKGVAAPTALAPEHQAVHDKLNALSGAAFDREYMSAMVKDHSDAVAAFQGEVSSGSDADLKQFATKTLPSLQQHQKRANELAAKLK